MSCSHWEEPIALYAGGDLAPADAVEVEQHVVECARCRLFFSSLQRSMELLREIHAEPVAPAHFAAVRSRVLAEIERPPRQPAWVWGLAAAAAIALLVMRGAGLRPARHVQPRAPLMAAVASSQPPAVTAAAKTRMPPIDRAGRKARLRAVPTAPPAPPLLVKLTTDDPNVIIYWIADQKGE